ncbi:unnamed protein product [Calypogeia fissa]
MADDRMKVSQQQASLVFTDLIESLIVDIATEAHRAARLGFDYKLNVEEEEEVRLAAHARAVVGDSGAIGTEIGNKHTIDVFGQTHPTIANEMFECMNCGRPIVAGRFAPHLEKCMGKGRKARIKASRNMSSSQQRRARSSPISSYGATGSGTATAGRTPNRTPNRTLEDIQRDIQREPADANDGESEESHDDDEKVNRARVQAGHFQDLSYGVPRPGKARSKKTSSGGVWKTKGTSLPQTSAASPGCLVPVPLQVSPVRASCAASVASLAEGAPGGAAGMTVEVAVEQFNSFMSGRVPTSGDMASKKGPKQGGAGQGHVKIRRGGEKKKQKNLGQVLAGSPPVTKVNEPEKHEDMDLSKENYSLLIGASDGAEQEMNLQNGSSGKVISDLSSDLYSNCNRSNLRNLSGEPSSTAGSVGDSGKRPVMEAVTGRVGNNSKGKSHASRLGLGVDVGARINSPQVDGAGDQVGNEEMVDFGKKKKRLKATSKLKQQGQQASVAVSASVTPNSIYLYSSIRDCLTDSSYRGATWKVPSSISSPFSTNR